MTSVTDDEDVARGAEVLAALSDAIIDLRHEIEALREEAHTKGTMNETAAKQSLNKLRDLVTYCAKAETYLNDSRRKQSGIAKGGYALDLDQARVEIGCKLDRLRTCGRSSTVPE